MTLYGECVFDVAQTREGERGRGRGRRKFSFVSVIKKSIENSMDQLPRNSRVMASSFWPGLGVNKSEYEL